MNLEALVQARTQTDELKEVLGRVHPWPSLRYGYAAVDMVEKLYQGIIPKYYGKETEVQILSPMTKGSLGTGNLNKAIQEKINPAGTGKVQLTVAGRIFRQGDRVIQKRNNYDLNVFNGDIGEISYVDNEVMELGVRFNAGQQVKEVTYFRENLLELDLALMPLPSINHRAVSLKPLSFPWSPSTSECYSAIWCILASQEQKI